MMVPYKSTLPTVNWWLGPQLRRSVPTSARMQLPAGEATSLPPQSTNRLRHHRKDRPVALELSRTEKRDTLTVPDARRGRLLTANVFGDGILSRNVALSPWSATPLSTVTYHPRPYSGYSNTAPQRFSLEVRRQMATAAALGSFPTAAPSRQPGLTGWAVHRSKLAALMQNRRSWGLTGIHSRGQRRGRTVFGVNRLMDRSGRRKQPWTPGTPPGPPGRTEASRFDAGLTY